MSAVLQGSLVCCLALALLHPAAQSFAATRETPTGKRVKAYLDAVPAVDTHDHLWPFTTYYPFEVLVVNVTTLVRGFHASEFSNRWDSPYRFASDKGLEMKSLDDYLLVLERLFQKAKTAGDKLRADRCSASGYKSGFQEGAGYF